MRRDWDFIRSLLLMAESQSGLTEPPEELDGYRRDKWAYHTKLLHQGGMLDSTDNRLTWHGCELLEKIRNDTLWQKIKQELQERQIGLSEAHIRAYSDQLTKKVLGI